MGKVKSMDRNMRRHITINDMALWEQIDKVMELDEYKKSFNKVIMEALYLGLPELIKKLFCKVTLEKETPTQEKLVRRIDGINEEYFYDIVLLLKEVILNVVINKSILSSLFNTKVLDYKNFAINGDSFDSGKYSGTPKHLVDYEAEQLKKLWS